MYHAFKQCKKLGALAQVHAENGDLIAEVYSNILMHSFSFIVEYLGGEEDVRVRNYWS